MGKRVLCLLLAVAAAFSLAAPALAEGDSAAGWVEVNGKVYYLNDEGQPLTGWRKIEGQKYYFSPDGVLATGWKTINDRRYYFGKDGVPYTGLRYVATAKKMYLFSNTGVMQRDQTVTLLGREYEIGSNGVVKGYATDVSPKAAAVLDQVGWDLRAAFDWSASLTYYDRSNRAPEGAVHTDWYADYGFTNLCGNCYVMAATFYQMAKLLGYEVYFIEGYVGSASGGVIPHSWTEIVVDGEVYVFDPDFTNEEGVDGYQIWYDKPGTWWYYDYERVV